MRILGVPNPSIEYILKHYQEVNHYLRKPYEESDEYLEGLIDLAHEIGQRNGATPTTWEAASTVLLNMITNQGYG